MQRMGKVHSANYNGEEEKGRRQHMQRHHFLPFDLPFFPKNVVPLHHDNNG